MAAFCQRSDITVVPAPEIERDSLTSDPGWPGVTGRNWYEPNTSTLFFPDPYIVFWWSSQGKPTQDVSRRESSYIRTSIVGTGLKNYPPLCLLELLNARKRAGPQGREYKWGRWSEVLCLSQNVIRLFISVLCPPQLKGHWLDGAQWRDFPHRFSIIRRDAVIV